MKNYKQSIREAIDAVPVCNRGNLSPSVLTESERSDAWS